MVQFNDTDPIWSLPAASTYVGYGKQYSSDRAGRFVVGDGLPEYLKDWSDAEKAKLATWILDHNRGGGVPLLNAGNVPGIRQRRSLGFLQKVDRFLLMLDADKYRAGKLLPWWNGREGEQSVRLRHRTMLWIEAESDDEFYALGLAFLDAGILHRDTPSSAARLGPKAYERLDQLASGAPSTDQAFVAMWFGDEVSAAYEKGIAPAVEDAGYSPLRVDRQEHNNKIDDEIIAQIRRSRFVVADFTCELRDTQQGKVAIARGGVYYEAGFAQGLGIPVIWCVRADQINDVHFDTRQFNHITWNNADDLRHRLSARISASIGWGPRAKIRTVD